MQAAGAKPLIPAVSSLLPLVPAGAWSSQISLWDVLWSSLELSDMEWNGSRDTWIHSTQPLLCLSPHMEDKMFTCHAGHFSNLVSSTRKGHKTFITWKNILESLSFPCWHSLFSLHYYSLPLTQGAHQKVGFISCGPLGTTAN